MPEPPAIGDFDADELRSATLRRKLAAAKLAATEAEVNEHEAMVKSKRVRRE